MDPQERPPNTSGSPEPIAGRCGAKIRLSDPPRYCTRYPKKNGNGRCKNHGGDSPAGGILHPAWKTGKFSKYLPAPIAARVSESFNSPELLSLRTESALLDARFTMLMERLHTGESGSLWKSLTEAWSEFQDANRRIRTGREKMQAIHVEDPDAERKTRQCQDQINDAQKAAADSMTEIGRLIAQGHQDETSWRELIDLSHEVVGVKRAEFDRLAKLRQLMTAEEVLALVYGLQMAVAEVVTDPKQRSQIGQRFLQLMPASSNSPAGDG
jgi:hypothetical protein